MRATEKVSQGAKSHGTRLAWVGLADADRGALFLEGLEDIAVDMLDLNLENSGIEAR